MKRRITLFLTAVIIVTMILPQAAWGNSETADNTYQFQTRVLPYSAQMEDETSVRVDWKSAECKAFILSWKKAGDSDDSVQSVRIDDPKARAYVVEGLEKKADYIFSVKGVLTDAEGNDLFTEDYDIEGATYIKTPKYASCQLGSTCITSYWYTRESYVKLKIYRAESKNGTYQLIQTLDARDVYDDPYFDRQDRQYMRFVCNDGNVKKGKTYYYKAQVEGTIGEKTYTSEMSEAIARSAKNEAGSFTTKLLNKRKTYTKQIVIKVTSDKANYTTYLNNFKKLSYEKNAKLKNRKVVKAEYSRNGKKYYTLKNKNVAVKAGQTFYLRLTMKSRYWISKNGNEGFIVLGAKYARPAYTGKRDNVNLYIDFFNRENGAYIRKDKAFNREPDPFYDIVGGGEVGLEAKKVNASCVKLYWSNIGSVNYAVRYGKTQASVAPSQGNPIIVPAYQVELLVDGLEKGKTYYFSIMPYSDGSEVDEDNYGLKWDGKTFTPFRFKI